MMVQHVSLENKYDRTSQRENASYMHMLVLDAVLQHVHVHAFLFRMYMCMLA